MACGLAWEVVRLMRKPLVVLWRWFGAPSATLDGGGGTVAAGNAGELVLGGSKAGVWVRGFGVRAQGQRRLWQGTGG